MAYGSFAYASAGYSASPALAAGVSKILTIAGVDYLPQYETGSLSIRETIQNKSNVMTLDILVRPGQSAPQEGAEIIFKDGSRFLFAGYISKISPEETGKGQLFKYEVEASDYSFIFNSKVARRGYQNETLGAIVADLMAAYVAAYGFDLSNVAAGPTIKSVTFDHISIRACFEKLQKLTGYNWYVDYQKYLYFQPSMAMPAPEGITDDSDNFEEIAISRDISQVRNSVIVEGSANGEESASPISESFTGDGETRAWKLEAKPSEIISIKINGVTQQFSLDVNKRDTDFFTYSFEGASIALTESPATPTGSDTILITYYPRIPIIVQRTDPASIAFFAALDGGDGVYEHTIKDPSITSKAEAAARAAQELETFAMPLVDATFVTRTSLLQAGSIFSAGQYLTANLPTYGIDEDAAFLIQEIGITIDESEDDSEYTYVIRFGGKLVGVREFLETLASETDEVQDVDEILTIEYLSDAAEIADTAPTHEIFTPPFLYGPWPAWRVPLTIPAGTVTADLTGFPVYVDLSDMPDHFFENVRSDGGDILVTLDDGKTRVPVEVVAIDTTAKTGELWFNTDLLTASDNLFYVHYGHANITLPAANSSYGSQAVWGSNAKLVAHMNGTAADSSANGNVPTISGPVLTTDRFGNANSAYSFDGINDLINYSKDANATTKFCIKGWFSPETLGSQMGWVKAANGQSTLYPRVFINSANKPNMQYRIDGVTRTTSVGAATMSANSWYWFAGLIDVTTGGQFYLNGALYGTQSATGAAIDGGTAQFFLGGQTDVTHIFFKGKLSDISLWDTTFSPNFLAAEYANQSSPSTFYTVGSYLRSRVARYNLAEWQ